MREPHRVGNAPHSNGATSGETPGHNIEARRLMEVSRSSITSALEDQQSRRARALGGRHARNERRTGYRDSDRVRVLARSRTVGCWIVGLAL
jgi:hypothetical protein